MAVDEGAKELRVSVVISPAVPAFRDATLHVRLEEVSRADAPAALVAEAKLGHVSHDPAPGEWDGTRLVVVLCVPPMAAAGIEAQRDYAVRAWMEFREGDPSARSGGLSSDQRHPVLTRGFGSQAAIRLEPQDRRG